MFEVAKAYLYLVDRRGQRWTDAVGATDGIRARGVSNEGFSLTRIYPDEKGHLPDEAGARSGRARRRRVRSRARRCSPRWPSWAADDGADLAVWRVRR